jgi:hypothetical protein
VVVIVVVVVVEVVVVVVEALVVVEVVVVVIEQHGHLRLGPVHVGDGDSISSSTCRRVSNYLPPSPLQFCKDVAPTSICKSPTAFCKSHCFIRSQGQKDVAPDNAGATDCMEEHRHYTLNLNS